MTRKQQRVFWPGVLVIAIASGALALVTARAISNRKPVPAPHNSSKTLLPPQDARVVEQKGPRNLSLQPEAFNLGRRLGTRFSPDKRDQSILTGTLTIGAERKTLSAVRQQTSAGERVEITVVGSLGLLTWDAEQGAMSSTARASSSERDLIERLVLDSPDQFVLAQLRGASYYTIARYARPAEATDGYTGPLWNIVRVGDPEPDGEKQPKSPWRLYYINTVTGLVDRIVSEVQGQRIVAEMSNWTEINGEKVPANITWTSQGQPIMSFHLTLFTRTQ
jgi:hypothetical protein